MVRPIGLRRISFQPNMTYFKPMGIPMWNLTEVILTFDELEAIRLVDSEDLEQIEAGRRMKISQSTLSRLLKIGRKKIANALVNGHAIRIQGGNFRITTIQKNEHPRGRYGRQSRRKRMNFGQRPDG